MRGGDCNVRSRMEALNAKSKGLEATRRCGEEQGEALRIEDLSDVNCFPSEYPKSPCYTTRKSDTVVFQEYPCYSRLIFVRSLSFHHSPSSSRLYLYFFYIFVFDAWTTVAARHDGQTFCGQPAQSRQHKPQADRLLPIAKHAGLVHLPVHVPASVLSTRPVAGNDEQRQPRLQPAAPRLANALAAQAEA